MDLEALEDLGLTHNEAKIYYTLSKLGPSSAGDLTKSVNLHRSRVYEALDKLIQKGLVHFSIFNKTKKFQAKNPSSLLDLLSERKSNIEKIIPDLSKIQSNQETPQNVEAYSGVGGIKSILTELLNYRRYKALGAPKESYEIMGETFWKNYNQKLNAKKIESQMIFNEELKEWSKEVLEINKHTKIKFLKKQHENLTETIIVKDLVMIIIWSFNPVGIIIRDHSIAKAYNQFFEILWKQAKP